MATANGSVKLAFHKASGNFCKTVNGKRFYLGKDRDEAIETWFKFKSDFEVGIDPRKVKRQIATKRLTVRDGCNLFLNSRKSEIMHNTWQNLREQCYHIVALLGADTQIGTLGPEHFAVLRDHYDNGNPITLGNRIQRTKQVFKWLAEREHVEPVKYGIDFKKPSTKAVRRHRRQQADRTLLPGEILSAINELGIHYRAAALLGINCGFGPTDVVELPTKAVDFTDAIIAWPRPKTEVTRRCPLWDETIEALKLSDHYRIKEVPKDRFFGFRRKGKQDANQVSIRFGIALQLIGADRAGASFYSLRHSLATVGREANDDTALRIIMGHVDDSILDEHYTHRFPRERLDAVSEHVRAWLFGRQLGKFTNSQSGRKPR